MNRFSLPKDRRPMECTTNPGDVVFVPHGWWHSVINLDESNIAITHNYISPSNLGNALKFFVEKQDQISGCRDRKESIKREQMYKEFVKALKDKAPGHLCKALKQRRWTCRAWKGEENQNVQLDKYKDIAKNGKEDTKRCNKKQRFDAEKNGVKNFAFSFLS